MSALNLAEVVGKLAEAAVPEPDLHEMIDPLGIEIATFDVEFAYAAGLLRPVTRHAGLSLGDRACLVLAQRQGLPALTTDRAWAGLNLDVVVRIIR
jgi:PIN domain nuclease of toxin-antitoxin system